MILPHKVGLLKPLEMIWNIVNIKQSDFSTAINGQWYLDRQSGVQ